MKSLFNKFEKFISKVKRDGLISATKRAWVKIKSEYLQKLNPLSYFSFVKNKKKFDKELNSILYKNKYDRIILWRSSIGYNIPLFQRPQHLAKQLANQKCLVFYEASNIVDKIDFIKKIDNNFYLVNYDNLMFNKFINTKLSMINTVPKYLYTASTCWDFDDKVLKSYIDKGYRFIYDYLDALSPELAGTDKIPVNVEKIHNYVINNVNNAFVVTTADSLYEDMLKKRKTDKNLVFACNGVNIEDFQKLNKKVVLEDRFKEVIKKGKVIGYYGALASWFDYDLVKYIAKKRPEYNIVLIGAKYDTSFDKENLNEYENIHYFEPKKYYELPYYAKHFDVCTLPFVLNEITYSTNPIKIFEYMAMGKPIVSTDLKECRKYKSVNIGHTKEEFLNLIDKQLENNDQNYKNILKKEAKENTWEEKAKTIVIGLKSYEKENNHQSNDDALSEIFYKIYQQNYSEDVKTKLSKDIVKKNKLFIITINSELCVKAQENPKYKDILLRKEVLLVPDSISISYVMKKSFKQKLKRYPGIELLVDMLKEANRQHKSIYLYGGTKKVNDDMTKYVKKNYKDIKVLGSKDGYNHSDKDVEKDILKLKPDMVVVALGVPKQELFINDIYDKVNKGIFIGVGGSFDVLSGNTKRAPKLLRKINLEWLYRIVKDPKRFGRFYDNNIKFIFERKKRK